MFNEKEAAEIAKAQNEEIAITGKFVELMGFGENKSNGVSALIKTYDSIIADAAERKIDKAAFIPQAIIEIENSVGRDQMPRILDSINQGIKAYRNRNCGAMPPAALVASAMGAGVVIQTGLKEDTTAGLFDSARDANFMGDSVSAAGHTHTAEVPSLAMVTIATIIANGISIVSYLPNPRGTNTVPLVYVRQVAGLSYGQMMQGEYLDGIKSALQYIDSVHRFKMAANGGRTTFTVTPKRQSTVDLEPVGDARLPIVLGATAITVNGIFVANDEQSNRSGGSTAGTYSLFAQDPEGFVINGETYKVTGGSVNLTTDAVSITFDKALPEGVDVKVEVVANYEAKDANGNYILQAPSVDTRNSYTHVSARPIRAIYTATIDAITQMQNELGVDVRAAFVAVVIAKLMLEQNCRLLSQARDVAIGSGLQRELDLSRGTDLASAFNKTADLGAELIPAVEDFKRRIAGAVSHLPSGYDIFVTGAFSSVVRSLADDTNFIPSSLSVGIPNAIVRIGSRGSDNYYYVPESANVLTEEQINIVTGVDSTDPDAPVEITQAVTASEVLIIGRNETAAKSMFVGHIAVPVITEDVRARTFEKGVTVYTRQAAQVNRDSRFGRQAGLLRVINLPKSTTSDLSETAA